MKLDWAAVLLPAIAAGVVSACGHDHEHHAKAKDFTPEELAELERKWGMEVGPRCSNHKDQETD